MSSAQAINALEGRSAFYRMLASLYWMPLTQEQIYHMVANPIDSGIDNDSPLKDGLSTMASFLMSVNSGTRQQLAVDFTTSLGGVGLMEGKSSLPYKSLFTGSEDTLFQEEYMEVFEAYKRNYVKRREGLHYPDDHITFMFEFMAILSDRMALALSDGNSQELEQWAKESLSFLDSQLMSWFPLLEERALKFIETPFYQGLLSATNAFLHFDKEVLEGFLEEPA